MKVATNPVELAIAASLLGGKLNTKDVASFAKDIGAALNVGEDVWSEAAKKWAGAEQNLTWRGQAEKLLEANRELLANLAGSIEAMSAVAGAPRTTTNVAILNDYLAQHGFVGGQRAKNLSSVIGGDAFLQPGRFAALPDGVTTPVAIEVGKKRTASIPISVDTHALKDPTINRLSDAMTAQWGFLHERAVEGFVNVNTLTRSAYNAYGIRQILDNLEQRDVKNARVLLVTGYESPIHELLESDRVKEVRVVDLSAASAELVAKKYANHPNASKLKIEVADCSGVSAQLQSEAMDALSVSASKGEAPPAAIVSDYLKKVALKENEVPLPFGTGSFDAVHIPFVLGALDLGPVTDAMVKHRAATNTKGVTGYEDYLGSAMLSSSEAQQSTATNTKHVLDEFSRITKDGGLVVANLWARPQKETPGKIRFSDQPIDPATLDGMLAGFDHLFSGNPQPTLQHTVGHVIAKTKE